jgi:hypothetical protein
MTNSFTYTRCVPPLQFSTGPSIFLKLWSLRSVDPGWRVAPSAHANQACHIFFRDGYDKIGWWKLKAWTFPRIISAWRFGGRQWSRRFKRQLECNIAPLCFLSHCPVNRSTSIYFRKVSTRLYSEDRRLGLLSSPSNLFILLSLIHNGRWRSAFLPPP